MSAFFAMHWHLMSNRQRFLPQYAYGGSATCAKRDDKNTSSVNHRSLEMGSNPSTMNVREANKDISTCEEVDHSQGISKVTVKHPQTLEVWFADMHLDM